MQHHALQRAMEIARIIACLSNQVEWPAEEELMRIRIGVVTNSGSSMLHCKFSISN
jgi:hypothetical protein